MPYPAYLDEYGVSGGRSMSLAFAWMSSESSFAKGWMRPLISTGAVCSTRAVIATSPACSADMVVTLPVTSVRLDE